MYLADSFQYICDSSETQVTWYRMGFQWLCCCGGCSPACYLCISNLNVCGVMRHEDIWLICFPRGSWLELDCLAHDTAYTRSKYWRMNFRGLSSTLLAPIYMHTACRKTPPKIVYMWDEPLYSRLGNSWQIMQQNKQLHMAYSAVFFLPSLKQWVRGCELFTTQVNTGALWVWINFYVKAREQFLAS